MPTIADQITRLQGAKSDLKTSIEGKGVTVPAATKIDGYAALVDQIQQGGGGGHTGTVDTAGLTALGWDSTDIQWLQDHVWWDAEDDAEWAVTEANKAFGPNGATPLTWNTRSSIQYNPDVRYLPKLTPTAGLTSYANAFSYYVHLVAIPTHGWDTTAITNFSNCFYSCTNLRSMGDISYWVTSAATNIGGFLTVCSSIESLDLSHWNTSNVTSMAQIFMQDVNLKSLDISGWTFNKVTSMQMMCHTCSSLQTIKLPAIINAPLLTDISHVFNGCALTDITINLNAPALTNAQALFMNCRLSERAKITISSTVLSNITQLTYSCWCLADVDVTGIDTTACAQAGVSTGQTYSPVGFINAASIIKLGANFFNGTFTTLYMQGSNSWSRDSIYESLYTNQTTRDSNSNAVTVKLATQAYDRLSAQDISDIATKNITLTRG